MTTAAAKLIAERKLGRPSVDDCPSTLTDRGVEWVQVAEAAKRLKVTRGRVYHLVTDGRLRHLVRGRLMYVAAPDVAKYAAWRTALRKLLRASSTARN